jgi:hypothetical protein
VAVCLALQTEATLIEDGCAPLDILEIKGYGPGSPETLLQVYRRNGGLLPLPWRRATFFIGSALGPNGLGIFLLHIPVFLSDPRAWLSSYTNTWD